MYFTWRRTKLRAICSVLLSMTMVSAMLFSISEPTFAADLNEPAGQTVPKDNQPAALTAGESIIPTYEDAFQRMISLQEKYPEGMVWTNSEPYGPGKEAGESYSWKGGLIDGKRIVSVGCAAFAFVLSDEAFDNLPNRTFKTGDFTFEDVKPGDVLRVNGNSHVVIVLQVAAGGAIIAEGNYNGTVHWGRAMSKTEVENADLLLTRYPDGYSESPDNDVIIDSGNEGSLNWSLTKSGILIVSGNGAIPDYSVNDQKYPSWNRCQDQINTVVIEEGVTRIGNYAFCQNTNLLSVYIPDGAGSIGTSAFQGSGLVAVTIPGTVTSIGESAFRGCENLTSVSISEGLETIGDYSFRACMALEYIDFPASIKTVGAGAFTSCTKMRSVRFKPGTENAVIGDNAFTQCQQLMFVTLPQKLQKISNGMFSSCTSLSAIYIPASVNAENAIGENPFTATRLQYGGTLYYGGSKSDWRNAGGQRVLNAMPNMEIVYDVTFDDPFDVEGGTGLVEEPGAHEHDWTDTWSNNEAAHWHECVNNNCDITDNAQKDGYGEHIYGKWMIDVAAAADAEGSKHRDCSICGYCQTDRIPVNAAGSESEGNDTPSTPAPGTENSDDSDSTPGNDTVQPPKKNPLSKGKTFKVSNTTYKVTKVGAEAELTVSKSTAAKVTINTVTGPDGVKYKVTAISSKAMRNNKKMKNLTIGANVKTIGANAFYGCTKLTSAVIGKTSKSCLTAIGKNAFYGCKKLSKVTIKSTKLRSVGKQAFKGTKSSLKVKVPSKQLANYKKMLKKTGLKTRQITK